MTTATISTSGQFGSGSPTLSAGVSEVARQLCAELKRVVLDEVRTASGQNALLPLMALRDSYKEAELHVQHGDQALPTPAAMREAHEFLDALPQWAVAPTPLIEPSGTIAFEWDLGPHRWLLLALKGTGTIEHSAMLGMGNEQWGTRNFAGGLGREEMGLLAELMRMKV